jgi:hypothetical protein
MTAPHPPLPATPPDDELDHLLRAYFRSEVPAVWPPPPVPEPSASPVATQVLPTLPASSRPSSDTLRRPRYVLAASAAVLLALGWFLIEHNTATVTRIPNPTPGRGGNLMLPLTEASNPPVLQQLRKSPPAATPHSPAKNQPAEEPDTKRPPIKLP